MIAAADDAAETCETNGKPKLFQEKVSLKNDIIKKYVFCVNSVNMCQNMVKNDKILSKALKYCQKALTYCVCQSTT